MKSPWKDNDCAFAPMFDETVAFITPDSKKTSMRAAVFTDGMGDPVSDDMLDTEREDLTFVFCKKDWPFVKNVKRGTTLVRCNYNGLEYAVSEAKLDNCLGWCIKARSK